MPVSGIFIEDQAQTLAEQFEVTVLAVIPIGLRSLSRLHHRVCIERHKNLTVFRVYVPTVMRVARLRFLSSVYVAWLWLRQCLRDYGRPDIIHAHVVLPCGWIAAQASRKWDIPAILTEHTGPFTVHLYSSFHRKLVREALGKLSVLAVSPALQQRIYEFIPSVNVKVLGNVIKTRFFTPGETTFGRTLSKKRFLTISLLGYSKGVEYLLYATSLLRQRSNQPFELVIGGDGEDRRRLEQLARQLQLTDICRFTGLLDRQQVRDWMRWCDVFVLPSLHETFGVVLGEAMACGKPVIATRCGGPEFVVENGCGLLVPIADSQALADAMERFLSNQERYDPVFIRESVCRRFGEEVFLQNIERIYNTVWSTTR